LDRAITWQTSLEHSRQNLAWWTSPSHSRWDLAPSQSSLAAGRSSRAGHRGGVVGQLAGPRPRQAPIAPAPPSRLAQCQGRRGRWSAAVEAMDVVALVGGEDAATQGRGWLGALAPTWLRSGLASLATVWCGFCSLQRGSFDESKKHSD